MLVGRDQRARTWSEMSAAKERRDAAFYAGRDAQAERARTEAARTAALTSVSPPQRTTGWPGESEGARVAACRTGGWLRLEPTLSR